MKLSQLKPVIQEGLTPITFQLTLKEVIRDGKITNGAQTMLMAQLVDFFKLRPVNNIRNIYEYTASGATFNGIKQMPAKEQAELAQLLLDNLDASEEFLKTVYAPDMELNNWFSLVLRQQR
jgi:hypothetical protein